MRLIPLRWVALLLLLLHNAVSLMNSDLHCQTSRMESRKVTKSMWHSAHHGKDWRRKTVWKIGSMQIHLFIRETYLKYGWLLKNKTKQKSHHSSTQVSATAVYYNFPVPQQCSMRTDLKEPSELSVTAFHKQPELWNTHGTHIHTLCSLRASANTLKYDNHNFTFSDGTICYRQLSAAYFITYI